MAARAGAKGRRHRVARAPGPRHDEAPGAAPAHHRAQLAVRSPASARVAPVIAAMISS